MSLAVSTSPAPAPAASGGFLLLLPWNSPTCNTPRTAMNAGLKRCLARQNPETSSRGAGAPVAATGHPYIGRRRLHVCFLSCLSMRATSFTFTRTAHQGNLRIETLRYSSMAYFVFCTSTSVGNNAVNRSSLCDFHIKPSYCALLLLPHLPLKTLSKLPNPACKPLFVADLLKSPSSPTGSRANQSSPNLWCLGFSFFLLTALFLTTFFEEIYSSSSDMMSVRCYLVQCALYRSNNKRVIVTSPNRAYLMLFRLCGKAPPCTS